MKHGYLIIAHNEFELLKRLIQLLDDPRNELHIHIDTKVEAVDYTWLQKGIKYSDIYIYSKFSVGWGDESQVYCQMYLLEKAYKNQCEYYHFMSGVDLPIKTIDYIDAFFEAHRGMEFVHYDAPVASKEVEERVMYKHYLNKHYKRSPYKIVRKSTFILDSMLVHGQKVLGKKRNHDNLIIQKGCNWSSISNDLADYLIAKKKSVYRFVRHSKCADEVFIQTMVSNSRFKERLYNKEYNNNYESCVRYIEWENVKTPHTFTLNDLEQLRQTSCLFARKFSMLVDPHIVEEISALVQGRKGKDIMEKSTKEEVYV